MARKMTPKAIESVSVILALNAVRPNEAVSEAVEKAVYKTLAAVGFSDEALNEVRAAVNEVLNEAE